jgi:outer membrane receptor protein involved in Fe transport
LTPCYGFDDTLVPRSPYVDSLEEDTVSWRVGIDYHLSEESLVFANISKGFKTGSFPALAAANHTALAPVVQEEVLAYEVGTKTTFADDAIHLNAAIFYYEYKDKQVRGKYPDPIFGILDALINVPESEILGAEADVVFQVTEGLTLTGSVTYVDSEITEYEGTNLLGQANNFSCDPIPFTPELTYSLDVDYRIFMDNGGEVFMGLRAVGQDDSDAAIGAERIAWPEGPYSRAVDPYPYVLDGYTTLDARLGYESPDQSWRVMLWGKNITDEYYWTTIIPASDDIARFAGRPRTYGVTVGYNF